MNNEHDSPETQRAGQDSGLSTQHSALLLCDQVVFTSVRSGIAEGYRIIAASPGVQPAEKVEITRRSPSHGGLTDDDPGAVGLESYTLPTKRHCVAYCCYAGSEHTARGGQRVYTHAIILDRQAWRQFQANPVAVHALLARQVESTGPVLKPAGRLEKISLAPQARATNIAASISGTASADIMDLALTAAGDLLGGRTSVLCGAANPYRLMEKVLLSLPLEVRETLNSSIDIRFSPARKMRLVLTAEPKPELQRRIAGLNIRLRNAGSNAASSPAVEPPTAFAAWEQLLRRWWREGRREDIHRLTGELCRGISSDALNRIATICEDTDAIATLSPEETASMAARYASRKPATRAEQVLTKELLAAAASDLSER